MPTHEKGPPIIRRSALLSSGDPKKWKVGEIVTVIIAFDEGQADYRYVLLKKCDPDGSFYGHSVGIEELELLKKRKRGVGQRVVGLRTDNLKNPGWIVPWDGTIDGLIEILATTNSITQFLFPNQR